MSLLRKFSPEPSLLAEFAHDRCRACVVIPARNEERTLAPTLDALAAQRDGDGRLLPRETYEVVLLLNNCTDRSAEVVRAWQAQNPGFALHSVERVLPGEQAHAGWARRLAMDTAWHRLQRAGAGNAAILSTDADTLVDPGWIAGNLRALDEGADAVGGAIRLEGSELERLSAGVQRAYTRDRQYQRLVAELEDLLDPQVGDPWPRHLEHFGASLACTPQAYAKAGGLPPVKPLEDVAFVDALRRSGARLRHDPAVGVATSARQDGRAEIGLSHQLRLWHSMTKAGMPQRVPSAAALMHRFKTLRSLREIFAGADVERLRGDWAKRLRKERMGADSEAEFLFNVDCDGLIRESGPSARDGEITQVNSQLVKAIARLRAGRFEPASAPARAAAPARTAASGLADSMRSLSPV